MISVGSFSLSLLYGGPLLHPALELTKLGSVDTHFAAFQYTSRLAQYDFVVELL